MRIFLLFLYFLQILASNSFVAQERIPVFENIVDGLPSTEVHDIYQDSVGFMWFATDRGICKYNGDRISIIDSDQYLSSNVFFKFFEQNPRKVWVVNGKNRLYWFNPSDKIIKLKGHKQNEEIETAFREVQMIHLISDLKFINNEMYISFRSTPGFLVVDSKKGCKWKLAQKDLLLDNYDDIYLKLVCNTEQAYTQLTKVPEMRGQKNKIMTNFCLLKIVRNENLGLFNDFGIACELEFRNRKYYAISDYLIQVSNGKIKISKLPSRILTMNKNENNLLVGTYNGVYEVDDEMKIERSFLTDLCITKIFKDKNGRYWISTTQQGVFLPQDFQSEEMRFDFNFKVSNIQLVKAGIQLFDYDRNEVVFFNKNENYLQNLKNVFVTPDRISFTDTKVLNYINTSRPITTKNYFSGNEKVYQFFSEDFINQNYFISTGFIAHNNNGYDQFFKFAGTNEAKFCLQLNAKTILVGSEKGLYHLDIETRELSAPLKNTEKLDFLSCKKVNGKLIILTTSGIFYFKNNELVKLPIAHKSRFRGMHLEDNKRIWFFSDNEIFTLDVKNQDLKIEPYYYYFGDRNTFISSLVALNNKLWVATKKGLIISKISQTGRKKLSSDFKIVIDSININDRNSNFQKKIESYEDEKIYVYFQTLSFDRLHSRDLEYSIDGKNWYETNKSSILISGLDAGLNTLKIRRIDFPEIILFELPIDVSKRFYRQNWFILIIIFLMLTLIFIIFRAITQVRERKRKLELEKLKLELQLLTSKMNPHFTFNTINSIQHYILNSDRKEAIKYLSDFALLIRKSLDFSMTDKISLSEEKEFLKLYVDLENKRFNSNYVMTFSVDSSIDVARMEIPSMLIQPLVENIVLHANYSQDEIKKVDVAVSFINRTYLINVRDYGQGIHRESSDINHKSYALKILLARVKMINGDKFEEDDVQVGYTDVEIKKGTSVNIKLRG